MKKAVRYKTLIILLAVAILASCSSTQKDLQFVNFRGTVFGTNYSVSYYCSQGRNLQASIDSLFYVFNQSLSYYVPGSLISRINRNETDTMDAYFQAVLERSLEIAQETNGAFDPTVSPLVNAWGFGFDDPKIMTQEVIDSLKAITGFQHITIYANRVIREIPYIQFDFNAIAKGYASDLAGRFLESKGINTYMVEIGGDLVARGLKPDGSPWRIGIEKPAANMLAPQEWAYLVEMHNRALATSGTTRKYIEKDGAKFSHTIDPRTGRPVDHNLLSVSVFADDCMSADGFATAFMVMGLEKSIEFVNSRDDLDAFFIFSDQNGELDSFTSPGLTIIPRSELGI